MSRFGQTAQVLGTSDVTHGECETGLSASDLKRGRLGLGKRKVEFSDRVNGSAAAGAAAADETKTSSSANQCAPGGGKSVDDNLPMSESEGSNCACACTELEHVWNGHGRLDPIITNTNGGRLSSSGSTASTDGERTPHSVICNLLRCPPPTAASASNTITPSTFQSQVFSINNPYECSKNEQSGTSSCPYPCEMSNTEWMQSQYVERKQSRSFNSHSNSNSVPAVVVVPNVHRSSTSTNPRPNITTSTFGTILRPTLTLPLPIRKRESEQQKQWEAELDLIVPASVDIQPNYGPTTLSRQTANVNVNATIHHSSADTLPSITKGCLDLSTFPKEIIPNHHHHHAPRSKTSSESQNSRLILIPEPTSFVPESRTGSSLRLSQQQQPTSLSPIDPNEDKIPARRRRLFCDGFELDLRQVCVVCGFLIVAAALGVGVGVPIALKMSQRGSSSGGLKSDTVRKLLAEVPLIDGHNDLAWNLRKFLQNQLLDVNFDKDLRQFEPFAGSAWSHTDLKRLREGEVGGQLWSAYVPCSAQHLDAVQIAVEQIDVIKRLVDKYKGSLSLVTSVHDVERAHMEKKIGSLIAVEGGHAIGNSLAVLRMLYTLGARSLTLTHNCNTPWADSASSDQHLPDRGGLTEFGKLVVLESNRLGLIVDLAHVSVQTMKDALGVSRAPLIFSHSAAAALCNHSRNVPDDVLRLVTSNSGLVMVSFYNVFIACNETASMDNVIAHIEHIRQVAGVDHVGIGAGYDGINFVPKGLEDVSKYPNLVEALLSSSTHPWTELDLKKLIGLNFLRVFRQVEVVRDEWKRVGVGPIEDWIPKGELDGHPNTCTYRGAS